MYEFRAAQSERHQLEKIVLRSVLFINESVSKYMAGLNQFGESNVNTKIVGHYTT